MTVPVPVRLAALWASAMFLYVYGDLIGLYLPGRLAGIAAGDLGPLGRASPALLAGIALVMAIPAVMVALSLLLSSRVNRAANLVLGCVYSLIMAATLFTAPAYYLLLGAAAIAMTTQIAWQAWRWS